MAMKQKDMTQLSIDTVLPNLPGAPAKYANSSQPII
jgi:hypothetical protein